MSCSKCGSDRYVIKHHTSYHPPITVDICRSCHKKIHNSGGAPTCDPTTISSSVRNIRRVAAFKRHELESFNTALSRALDAAEAKGK